MIELYSSEMREVKSRAGTLRARRAEETRQRILGAARRRFADAGYAATTLQQVAEGAEVAVQTVYAIFGSKAAILRALRDSVVEDQAASAAYREALASDAPEAALRSFARSMRLRWEAGHDLVGAMAKAAAADPAIRVDVDAALASRRHGIRQLAERVGVLASRDPRRIEALLDAMSMAGTYEQLVVVHGWSPDEYESWLADALARLLLPG